MFYRLSDGEEIMTLALYFLIYRSVTDRRTNRRTFSAMAIYQRLQFACYATALVKNLYPTFSSGFAHPYLKRYLFRGTACRLSESQYRLATIRNIK